MKNITKICICAFLASLSLAGCRQEEVMTYGESKAGIMFVYDSKIVSTQQRDTMVYSFALNAPDEEFVVIDIPVTYTGLVKNYDRTVVMEVDKEPYDPQSRYEVLTGIVPADSTTGTVSIKLWNTPNLDTVGDTITLKLVENEDFTVRYFSGYYRNGDRLSIVFQDIISQPSWWQWREESVIGRYTEQKLRIILEVMGSIDTSPVSTPDDSGYLDEYAYNVFLLNRYCKENNIVDEDGKPVRFDWNS